MLIFFILSYWWLNNAGEDFGIEHEDINYTDAEFNGSTITINVMADGANYHHEVYSGRAIREEFIDAFLDQQLDSPNETQNIIGQQILSVASGSKGYKNSSGVAYGSRVSSYYFYDYNGRNESLEYFVCNRPEKWNISIIALIDRFCKSRECKYQRTDKLPHQFVDNCLYHAKDAQSQKHYVVPAGNYTSDVFFSPPTRWPLVFSIGSVSNRGFILNHACEGAGLFMACPGTRENNDTAPAKIPAALPHPNDGWTDSFPESNASAAIFAGGLALIMEANPRLTLSDHFFICAMTATKNSPVSFLWHKNTFGLSHNRRSGFGRLNLGKAIELAKKWPKPLGKIKLYQTDSKKVPKEPISLTNAEDEVNVTIEIPPGKYRKVGKSRGELFEDEGELTATSAVVEIVLNLHFADLGFGSFTCQLVSPTGDNRYELKILTEWSDLNEEIAELHLPTYQFMGEKAVGNWTLCMPKIDMGSRGIIVHVGMDLYYVDEAPDPSLIDQADGANPNQYIEFHEDPNASRKNLKWDKKFEGVPPFTFLNKSVDFIAGEKATFNISINPNYQKCWVVSYLQSNDTNRVKVKPKITDGNTSMTLPYVPTIFRDGLEMLFVIESLGEGCGFSANMTVNYINNVYKGENFLWLPEYETNTIPLRTNKLTVNWALNLSNILDDGYSTSVCISVISIESLQVLRRYFERNTGSADIELIEGSEAISNRRFLLQISPSSPIDNDAITFDTIVQEIEIATESGLFLPYKNPFSLAILISIACLLSIIFLFVFIRIVCLAKKKIMKVDNEL